MPENRSITEISESLEKTERLLEKLLEEKSRAIEPEPKKGDSWLKLIGPGITIVILMAGIVGGWYTNKASVAVLQSDTQKIEAKVNKLEDTTHDIELRVVQEVSDLKSVKEDMSEVKQDIKEIKNKLLGPQ